MANKVQPGSAVAGRPLKFVSDTETNLDLDS
jgi:hypothetical protein